MNNQFLGKAFFDMEVINEHYHAWLSQKESLRKRFEAKLKFRDLK